MAELDENESLVEQLFREDFGFQIEKIPEGGARSADFSAFDGENYYLIELKTKYRSADEMSERESQLDEKGLAEFSRSIERRSNITKNISDALRQIESSDPDTEILRIVFFLLRDFDANERWKNILANLYGIETVVDWSDDNAGKECYYFHDSDYYRYRDRLDAAKILIATSDKAVLCLNDHSQNIDALRESPLVEKFGAGVIDPTKDEALGEIWIVSGGIERSNEQAVIAYLREKYSLSERTMAMNMGYASATVVVPIKRDTR